MSFSRARNDTRRREMFTKRFQSKYIVVLSISVLLNVHWYEPKTDKEEDLQAADDMLQFYFGAFAHPIFTEEGDFPPVMRERIANRSLAQGFQRSRLPVFTEKEKEMVRGSSDFFGLNHYTTYLAYRNTEEGLYESPSFLDDVNVVTYQPDEWETTQATWLKVVPWGFYKLLTYVRINYNNPNVFVLENGYASGVGLIDDRRVHYHRKYLEAMLDAIDEGSNIKMYGVWALMDSLEWTFGYTNPFGLYEVDYEDPSRTRTPRKSAFVYKEMLRTRSIDYSYDPDPYTLNMTIAEGH